MPCCFFSFPTNTQQKERSSRENTRHFHHHQPLCSQEAHPGPSGLQPHSFSGEHPRPAQAHHAHLPNHLRGIRKSAFSRFPIPYCSCSLLSFFLNDHHRLPTLPFLEAHQLAHTPTLIPITAISIQVGSALLLDLIQRSTAFTQAVSNNTHPIISFNNPLRRITQQPKLSPPTSMTAVTLKEDPNERLHQVARASTESKVVESGVEDPEEYEAHFLEMVKSSYDSAKKLAWSPHACCAVCCAVLERT